MKSPSEPTGEARLQEKIRGALQVLTEKDPAGWFSVATIAPVAGLHSATVRKVLRDCSEDEVPAVDGVRLSSRAGPRMKEYQLASGW
jgi:hypothetical protein